MSKFYRLLSSPKIRFLDDILIELEKEPVEQNEDCIAPKVCYFDSEPDKIFGSFRLTQPFIPEGKERLYFRIATLYLERENLISVIRVNPYTPTYLINYEGIVLVKNGGLGRKLFLEKWSGRLQRMAWIVALLMLILKIIIDLNYIPIKETNSDTTPNDSLNIYPTETKKAKEPLKEPLQEILPKVQTDSL